MAVPLALPDRLDRRALVPLYHQLQRLLQEKIDAGALRPGDPVPSESELIRQYQVSRVTVRQALQGLVRDGYVYRERGRGSFVAHRRFEERSQRFGGSMEELRRRGRAVESRILDLGPADVTNVQRELLDIAEDQWLLTYRRLIHSDGQPLMLSTVLVVMDRGVGFTEKDLVSESVVPLLRQRCGVDLGQTELAFGAVNPSEDEAGLLGVSESSPLLLVESLTRTAGGKRRLLSRALYRGDRYKYLTTAWTS